MKILKRKTLAALLAFSLLASLLPLGAQPALAAENAPQTLYVGNYQITNTSGTTYLKAGSTEGSLTAGSETDWTVKYDPGTATLTLNGATIQGGTSTGSVPYGAGIYAQCDSGESVSLTIELIGENTITGYYGIYVNAEISENSNGTDASLTITGENNGSLEVSGSFYGIFVKSGTGNASLTINDASVVAKTTQTNSGYAGVCVQSGARATNSPQLSLAVNGGSLTTSGSASGEGIQFIVGSFKANNATTSLTVSENAIVDARNGGISASGVSFTPNVNIGSTGGIVFNGTKGTVYGNVTLDESLTINQGETLTIPEGSTLNGNSNLTNNGTVTIENGGTLNNSESINNTGTINVENGGNLGGTPTGGTVVNAPTIGTQPTNQTVTAGNTATFTVAASGENLSYKWQQSTENGLSWTDIEGANSATYTIAATSTDMSGYQYRCVVSNSAGSVTSNAATLTVNSVPVTGVTLNTETLELFTSNTATLTATVEPSNATNKNVTWSSNNANVATVQNGTVTAVGAGEATITVTTEDGKKTATCKVTVTDKTYSITANTTALDFGSVYTGYAQPAAQTVTLTNTGNQPVTLTQPASTNSFEVGTLSKMELAVGETATFTIQPKDKLPRGSYSEQIAISNTNGEKAAITATFTVKEPPYTGKYSYEVSTSVGDHGALSVDRYATEGDKVTIDVTPDQAYKLDELSVTAGGKEVALTDNHDGTFSFTMPSADVRITATFAKDPDWTEPEEPATDVSDIFLDVAPNAWYKDAVQYAYDSGLMTGVSANEFAPEATTTRAMIVSMLARLEGVESAESAGFTDVAANDWYATAVNWAAASGITSGTGDGNFSPNTAITREQLAAILMNYAAYKGEDVSARADLTSYTDQPSTWAKETMSWAVAEGLISGVTADTLQPQGAATRAQVAAILQRFLAQ